MSLYVTSGATIGHLMFNVVHALAHQALAIDAPPGWLPFIVLVMFALPIIGLVMLINRPVIGAVAVVTAMSASLVFGFAFHFVVDSPDRLDSLGGGPLAAIFRATAVLLLVIELIAIAGAASMLRESVAQGSKS